jgi:prepilin-type processing-associated H-X9-DG protein
VAILPFIDQDALYKEFKLDEAWDSTHNKMLIARMPKIYGPIGGTKSDEGMTFYQAFMGPETVFNGNNKTKFLDITDGTSNTILAVEAAEAVVWTKPADLTLPKDKEVMPALGKHFNNGFNAAFCDGHIQLLPHAISPALLRALITPKGGEDIDKLSK